MVWIYGGGFSSGSSDPDVFEGSFVAATHNAIVVSMNYRVGPFGFLNLGIPEASGNVGLMDQSLALKWTYENIEAFGGDRNKITIFGEGGGSACVSYHLLAQPSWDYFSNAIMMSGTALCTWAFQSPKKSVKNAKMYAKEAGCDSEDAKEIVTCLRQKTPDELTSFALDLLFFKPTVDGSFITKSPEKLLKSKDFKRCNILLGYTSNEQSFFMSLLDKRFGRTNTDEPLVSVPEIRNLVNKVTLADSPIITNSSLAYDHLMQVYVHGIPRKRRDSNFKVLEAMVGDHDFKCPIIQLARAYAAEDLGVFLYRFHHTSSTSPWPEWMGVMHGYDVEFVFGMPYNSSGGFSAEDKRVSNMLLSYWVTFASTGNPNMEKSGVRMWRKFTESDQEYTVIKSGQMETKQYPRFTQCSFWTDFVPVLENHTESTALALARCAGTRTGAAVLSVLLSVMLSAIIASRNG
ncbi:acetylcholinesterase-like [Liolophura sinensis]|uniref:acetylcholinesterase-like n=1 Tax=Liolophura sinensis TaxID=3198878 RepID=UPI003158FDB9